MTQTQTAGLVPVVTLGWRLRMALEAGGVGVQEMADFLGLSRQTLLRYVTGEINPKRHVLLAWAMRTGVDASWLETGEAPAGSTGEGLDVVRHHGLEPRTR